VRAAPAAAAGTLLRRGLRGRGGCVGRRRAPPGLSRLLCHGFLPPPSHHALINVHLCKHDTHTHTHIHAHSLSSQPRAASLGGAHPRASACIRVQDQACSEIVAFAARRRLPFAVVPCCVYAYAFPTRRLRSGQPVRTYEDLVAWSVFAVHFPSKVCHCSCRSSSCFSVHPATAAAEVALGETIEYEYNCSCCGALASLVCRCVECGPSGTRVATLPFEGKNKVVFWKP